MDRKSSSRPGGPIYDSLIRISNVGDRKSDGSLDSDRQQAQSNLRAIRSLGGRLGKTFEALNESGSTIFSGPKWAEALARVQDDESDGVAVAYHDRLGRNTPAAYGYAAALHKAGGVLIVDGRVLDQNDPQDKAMFGMAMVQAELTYDLSRDRSLKTLARVRERGISCRLVYGYQRNEQPDGTLLEPEADRLKLIPEPETARVVKTIFLMRKRGARWTTIQRHLEEEGIRSPSGAPVWPTSTLAGIVKNRAYLGEVRINGHTAPKAHDRLVEPEDFDAAQPGALLPRTGLNKAGLAGLGLSRCASCGEALSVSGRGKVGGTFYACRRVRSGGRCSAPVTGDQGKIDTAVDRTLRALAAGELTPAKIKLELVSVRRDLADARAADKVAQVRIDEFVEVFGDDDEDIPTARAKLAALREAKRTTAARVAELQSKADAVGGFPESGEEWDKLSLAAKQHAARGVLDRVMLAPFPKGASKKFSDAGDRLTFIWR